jgi:phosphate starvation-inducible protein PhoH
VCQKKLEDYMKGLYNCPLAFMRGQTDPRFWVFETQNIHSQMALTVWGKILKVMVTGDQNGIDLQENHFQMLETLLSIKIEE